MPEKPGAVFSSGLLPVDPGLMGEIMDKIIKVTLGLFVIILVLFVSVVSYTAYVNTSYRNSLTGTYEYNCTITTNTVLSNVTLFLPVPADMTGNSPVISQISRQQVTGVPEDWTLTLFDTGKATLLKISAPRIGQNAVNGKRTNDKHYVRSERFFAYPDRHAFACRECSSLPPGSGYHYGCMSGRRSINRKYCQSALNTLPVPMLIIRLHHLHQ